LHDIAFALASSEAQYGLEQNDDKRNVLQADIEVLNA
jgi:hypothetical protein